jgi:hypothetical protein
MDKDNISKIKNTLQNLSASATQDEIENAIRNAFPRITQKKSKQEEVCL